MASGDGPRRRLGRGVLAAVVLPPIAFLALTVAASRAMHVPLPDFSRDPTATLHGSALTGVQSNVGVLVWWTGAAVAFFAAFLAPREGSDAAASSFLIWSGAITAVLTLDDLFQFHEDLAERYLRLNDKIVVAIYGIAVLAYLVRFRRLILRTDYPLLVAGLALFAGSNAVDLLLQDRWLSDWRIFVEDGLKLLGIVSWSAYLIRASRQLTARQAR